MTGWNLPPGCEVHHIPGNRPEDLAEEEFWEKLGEICPDVPQHILEDAGVQKLVESARDLAYSAGFSEGCAEARAEWADREFESEHADPQEPDAELVEAIESGELDADIT